MIFLDSRLFDQLNQGTPEAVQTALQQAVMLEHSTIPPYLYALYSIKPKSNVEIAALLRSVVIEEMLHMSLASNVLNAIGGAPVIDQPAFIPQYPGHLPGSVQGDLIVSLERFSLDLVQCTFMVIEEPETPLKFPDKALAAAAPPHTIGEFYLTIQRHIERLGDAIFTGDPARQLRHGFPPSVLIQVGDVASAVKAIQIIVEQGEGTKTSPLDPEHELAHYYRYAEIVHQRRLVPNPDAPPDAPEDQKYIYGGAPIPFDPAGVYPVVKNPKAAQYRPGSSARYACDTFNYTYTNLLKTLHLTFNGEPDRLSAAVGLMEALKLEATNMMSVTFDNGETAGPSFEYQPANP